MNPFEVYPWEPLALKPSAILDLMRQHRNDNLLVRFYYEGYVYDTGVVQQNNRAIFFLNEDAYPSMLGFASGACVEDVLFCDFTDKVSILCVNEEDPRGYFSE